VPELPEILAKKIRACYQRNKARDIFDLGTYTTRLLDQARIRRLAVVKLWQARDTVALRIQAVQFGGSDQAGKRRGALAAAPPGSSPIGGQNFLWKLRKLRFFQHR